MCKLSFISYVDFRCCYCPTNDGIHMCAGTKILDQHPGKVNFQTLDFPQYRTIHFTVSVTITIANEKIFSCFWKRCILFFSPGHLLGYIPKKSPLKFIWLNLYRQITAMELNDGFPWRSSHRKICRVEDWYIIHYIVSTCAAIADVYARCKYVPSLLHVYDVIWSADCIPITCKLYTSQPCEVFDNKMDRHCKTIRLHCKTIHQYLTVCKGAVRPYSNTEPPALRYDDTNSNNVDYCYL